MTPIRAGGRAVLPTGATVVWSVAEGLRGRRWRELVTVGGSFRRSMLLEASPAGRVTRLELSTAAGLLTLHPDADSRELHGNVVTPTGIRHLALRLEPRARIARGRILRRPTPSRFGASPICSPSASASLSRSSRSTMPSTHDRAPGRSRGPGWGTGPAQRGRVGRAHNEPRRAWHADPAGRGQLAAGGGLTRRSWTGCGQRPARGQSSSESRG